MRHVLYVALGLATLGSGARVFAQETPLGACTNPDSVAIVGNHRVSEADVRAASGLVAGAPANAKTFQDAVKNLFETGQFDDVQIACTTLRGATHRIITVKVTERPNLDLIRVTGTDKIGEKSVRDLIDITPGRPLQAGDVTRAITRIDSLYQNAGFYLIRITTDTATADGKTTVTFHIDEGHRLAISGLRLRGNHVFTDREIVRAMSVKPEAFPFWRKGEFDEDKFAADLAEHLPDIYARLGYVDFQVIKDTVIVDRARGKALLDITVSEGKQYRVGTFDVIGNRHFSTEEVNRFYPFGPNPATLTERAADALLLRRRAPPGIFDRQKWDDATTRLRTAYNNDGYIYASIRPITERVVGPDSQPRVNLRWEIDERNPAIVNRIEITGNDYTTEGCIRDALVIIPGDVFSQDRLIRSYQNLGNLGYFDTPIPPPDTRPTSDSGGDVDLVFHVKEKHTGNINFGASTGQGTGIGGFIGFDQPNLFGECKKGSIQWQYGRYINNLQVQYTDPTIHQSRVSGTLTAYNSQSKYFIGNLGQSTNLGGSIQLGWPVAKSLYTRLFTSYTLESVRYSGDTTTLLGSVANTCHGCIRSALSASIQRDTRIGLPFAAGGTLETVTLDFNGGPLGGAAHYQRLIGEVRGYSTIATFGQSGIGSEPMALVLGFKGRAGTVLGNTGPFFYTQAFAMGGVQFGEQLRGYPEFSISPNGYIPGTGTFNATRASFGNTFMTTTTELGLRFNSSIYSDLFFDAGNLYASPQDFDPGRLFRGAGVGVAVVTPLGPLGLDLGYGFDKTNTLGQARPGWQVHFKLGNIF
jgi:outer membrane protein insertion porin family